MPIRTSNKGYVRQPINKYLNTIINNLIPALESSVEDLSIGTNPIRHNTTVVTFAGNLKDRRIMIEFLSNHIELQHSKDTELFCDIYYLTGKESAGILDLTDISSCVEMIIGALYDLGYKSSEDIAKEKEEQEKAKQEELEKANKAKQIEPEEEPQEQPQESESVEEISPEQESAESIEEFKNMFDLYQKAMSDRGQLGSIMFVNIAVSAENSMRMLNITLTYISPTMCLVETEGISPKVNKTVSWNQAKDYIIKVANKVNGIISVEAVDESGKDLNLPEENQDLDLDINI